MRSLWRDIRFAARVLRRRLGFTIAAIVCLTLGIGATTAIFSVVNSVVMRPLPYRQPERLVRVYSEFPTFPNGGLRRFWISPPEFLDIRRDSKAWESLNAWVNGGVNLAGSESPVRATASFVSGALLESLGVQPMLGRLLTPKDDLPESPRTAVISYGLWQRAFGGDRNILHRDLRLDGAGCAIVGVMPPGFQFPPGEVDAPDLWAPLQLNPADPGGRGSHYLFLLGRLKAGLSLEQARQDAAILVDAWGKIDSPNSHHMHPKFHPMRLAPLHEEVVAGVRPAMLMMLAAVGFVLLIACVNVANLLLARAEGRQREVAIRRAMGAGTMNLLRQLTIEGLLLSFSGAVLGLAAAYAGLRAIVATSQGSIPRNGEIGIDGRVLLFTLAVSVATGLFFALAPLAQHLAQSLHGTLKASGGRATATIQAHRLRHAMVVAELGLALVLLIGAGLMVRAFWKLQAVHIGVRSENMLTMRLSLPEGIYQNDGRVLQFWMTLIERVRTLPGVQSATMMTGLPPVRALNANDTQIEGFAQRQGGPIQNVDFYQTAGPRFFETMGIPLIEGRLFDERDGASGAPSIIINQTMARTFWPGEGALGRRIRPGFRDPWRTVVGVVADVKNSGADRPTGTELFLPAGQTGGASMRDGFSLSTPASIRWRWPGRFAGRWPRSTRRCPFHESGRWTT